MSRKHAHDDERAGVANTRRHMEIVLGETVIVVDPEPDPMSFLDEADPRTYQYDADNAFPHPRKRSNWEMLRVGGLGGLILAGLYWLLTL